MVKVIGLCTIMGLGKSYSRSRIRSRAVSSGECVVSKFLNQLLGRCQGRNKWPQLRISETLAGKGQRLAARIALYHVVSSAPTRRIGPNDGPGLATIREGP